MTTRSASRPMSTQGLPAQPFFRTPEQRAALARQRYFEEHASPSGLVTEAVVHSWNRSRTIGHVPTKMPTLDPVSKGTLNAALSRNRCLLQAAELELHALEASLAGTHSRVILTDANGIIVHVMQGEQVPGQAVLNQASRVGVNLGEGQLGTTAPGIVVQTGMASAVLGGEHYYDMFQALRCAAAPIRDVRGRMVGVLDVSTEARGFGFDALSVVGIFATSIENRLLRAQSDHLLVLHFQTAHTLLNTPMEGLVGVSGSGLVEWVNGTGLRLLGCGEAGVGSPVEEVLGTGLNGLLSLCHAPQATLLHLPCGLGIWVRTELRDSGTGQFCADKASTEHQALSAKPEAPMPPLSDPAADPLQHTVTGNASPACEGSLDHPASTEAPSLAQALQQLIEKTLAANNGNVARTARLLGVSRGMVYRHLKRPAQAQDETT
jgi:sigma-54 dependent transcriptional regulator, acetoin dehydrogenase operon transcriptional activator AcoR